MRSTSGIRRCAAGALALAAVTAGWALTGATGGGPEAPGGGATGRAAGREGDPASGTAGASGGATGGARAPGTLPGFSFVAEPLGPPGRPGDRRVRPVAPGYENLRAWVSSTGAGVALFDVDDEIVSDDVCLVDPRRDTVTVEPAPGTHGGYRPFTLAAPERRPYEAPTGCLPADLDQDGLQDLVVYYWGRSPCLFMRIPGTRPSSAAFRRRDLTPEREIWNTGAATAGDFDGDGRLDLVFGNYFPDGVGVLDRTGRHGDAIMPGSLSNARDGGRDRLYLGRGLGVFGEARGAFDEVGGTGWTLALGAQDLDGDGLPELYVANDFGPDLLLVNESAPGEIRFHRASGTRHLTTPRSAVLGEDSFGSRGVGFTDLNADGVQDILVGNTAKDYGPHESNFAFVSESGEVHDRLHEGEAPYEDRAEELGLSRTGWSWDVKAADFDNDGSDEIVYATGFVLGEADRSARLREAAMSNDLAVSDPALWPALRAGDELSGHDANTFLTRGADGRYTDVAAPAGVGGETVGRALAVGDVDDDGRLDFAVANQWAASTLYRNHGVTAPFVGLRLRLPAGPCATTGGIMTGGTKATGTGPGGATAGGMTRPAIGATARLRLPGGGTLARQLYPAGGHNGVSAPELLFGLGDAEDGTAGGTAGGAVGSTVGGVGDSMAGGVVAGGAGGGSLPVELSWRDACGVPRTASTSLDPGWHHLLLTERGASEMKRS